MAGTEAFNATVVAGLRKLRVSIEALRAGHGIDGRTVFRRLCWAPNQPLIRPKKVRLTYLPSSPKVGGLRQTKVRFAPAEQS
jgi:hypothetical protein